MARCVLGNKMPGHKALLVRVQLGHHPGGEAVVNQISVHFAVTIHRGDGAVVGHQGRVTLLVKEAQVGTLETTTVGAMGSKIISE